MPETPKSEQQYAGVVEALQKFKTDTSSGAGGWIGGLIAIVIFLIMIAIMAFQAWQSGKEKSKLLHEKTVREEEVLRARTDAITAESNDKALEHMVHANDLEVAVETLELKIEAAERKHTSALAQINQISSWDQIDELLKPDHP